MVDWTAYVIFIVVIRGIGTIEGPIIGVLVFYLLQTNLAHFRFVVSDPAWASGDRRHAVRAKRNLGLSIGTLSDGSFPADAAIAREQRGAK